MNSKLSEKLRILLPSSGSLAEGSISFMAEKGINIENVTRNKVNIFLILLTSRLHQSLVAYLSIFHNQLLGLLMVGIIE